MAFRVLRYVTRIWDQYEREHPKARRLPAVIPLVVYQGPGRWASPVQLLDLIDLGPGGRQAVQAWLPRFEFLLDDLSAPTRTSCWTGSSPRRRWSPCCC